jgi:hypothetical protein
MGSASGPPQADMLHVTMAFVKALIGRAMTPRLELLQHTLERVSCDWAAMPSVSRIGTGREGACFFGFASGRCQCQEWVAGSSARGMGRWDGPKYLIYQWHGVIISLYWIGCGN